MDVRTYTPGCMGKKTIKLGKQGENNAVRLEFDCSAWLAEYPGAAVELNVIAPDGTTYNAELDGENGVYAFTVTERYTVYAGQGMLELVLRDVETATILKSATGYTETEYSPTAPQPETPGTPDIPAGVTGGYVRYDITQNLTSEEKARARKNIGAGTGDGTGGGGSGEPGKDGEDGGYYKPSVSSAGVLSWTASKSGMPAVNSANIKGPQGETGPTGPDGYSPTVKLTRQTDGVLITVTNKGGSQSEKVYDGTGGSGEGGGTGKNGVTFTPEVSDAGVISWTNDGGLTNPDPVNIKGPQGETGPTGPEGPTGPQGDPGENGGYYTPKVTTAGVLSWTASKSGMPAVNSANIKGPQGDTGPTGPEGPQGPKPVKGTDYFTAADKAQIVSDVLAALPTWEGGEY